MSANEKWYWRGRVARGTGEDRVLADARVKSLNRLEFYRGWDAEDRLRTKHTPKEIETSCKLFAALRQAVADLKNEFPLADWPGE